jgi:ABC-type glycerol-3-phosphate transport system substrate-binding protein
MSKFKIAVMVIFSVSIVIGLILFAMAKGGVGGSDSADLLVWGTVSEEAFTAGYNSSSIKDNKGIHVSYVYKNPADFERDFIEALADSTGPDIIVVREDFIYKNRNKILAIPYKTYSARDFKDRFVEESELLLVKDGVMGLPLVIDPLVMYWNRDIFSNNQITQPPKYWDEFTVDNNGVSLVSKITKKDSNANVLVSTVALGEWKNIVNAKEILSTFLLQAGTPITLRQDDDKVESVLNESFNYPVQPSLSAVNFYTQFSNPTSATYTWNRSLPNSLNMFLAGNLATYIGFASEVFNIQQKNSNLNFDVTTMPQIRGYNKKLVFGHMYSMSIVKQSKQSLGAYNLIVSMTEPTSVKAIEAITGLPPVRRDLLSDRPTNPSRVVFYDSAIISHAWIDPDSTASSNTFKDMIESITGGRARTLEALSKADNEIRAQLK